MKASELHLEKLRNYFASRDDVILAYLFGSYAKGTASPMRSDYDIAVYFKPKTGVFEYEESEWGEVDYKYEAEEVIWADLDKILDKDVDLVVLNRTPAYLTSAIMKTGICLKESDREIYLNLWLRATSDAEDYYALTDEYYQIMKRSQSLTAGDRKRLLDTLGFLREELQRLKQCEGIDQITYMHDWKSRNIVERSIEKVANAGIDIAKILLASHHKNIPDKYADMMVALGSIGVFDHEIARLLSAGAKLRNFIAHEYLDYRWQSVNRSDK